MQKIGPRISVMPSSLHQARIYPFHAWIPRKAELCRSQIIPDWIYQTFALTTRRLPWSLFILFWINVETECFRTWCAGKVFGFHCHTRVLKQTNVPEIISAG